MAFGRPPAIILLVLLAFFICRELPALASDWDEEPGKASKMKSAEPKLDTTKPATKYVLQGAVTHAESLPAMDPSLQAGSSFNSGSLHEPKYASNWFKIPNWFAGTFESNASTIDFVRDYASGKTAKPNKTVASSGREVHGFQKDAQGGIWHFYVQAGSSRSEQERQITYNTIDFYGPEFVSSNKVVMRVLATSLIVDRQSGIIVDSFRREDIKTYEPLQNGQVSVLYTSKSFDSHGRPRDLQNGHSVHNLVAPFQPIDHDGKNDYRQMLKDYLVRPDKTH